LTTAPIPIPDHLAKKLSTRARRALERKATPSCQEMLALPEVDLCRIGGSGTRTVKELQLLQRDILKAHPELLSCYWQPLDDPPVAVRLPEKRSTTKRALSAPPLPTIAELPPQRFRIGPAPWSILNKTLPELFQLSPLPLPYQLESRTDIGSLRLPTADLERLRAVAVFPEDSIDLLRSLTCYYLVQAGLSDVALSDMLAACAQFTAAGLPPQQVSIPNVANLSLYGELPPETVNGLVLPRFLFPALLGRQSGDTAAVSWRTVAEITERTVIDTLGVSGTALRAIGYLWQLQELAASVADSAQTGVPSKAYGDFADLADCYLRLATANIKGHWAEKLAKQCRSVLSGRLGLIGGRKVTLRELAGDLGVTRQRVEQLETKSLALLRSPATLQHLRYFWHLLDHLLATGSGVRYVSELGDQFRELLGWSSPPPELGLASFVALSPNYRVVRDSPLRISLASSRCACCPVGIAAIFKAVEATPDARLSLDGALEALQQACQSKRCPELRRITGVSKSLLHFLADSTTGLRVQGEELHHTEAQPQKAAYRQHLLQHVMLAAGRELHFTEIRRQLNEAMPDHPASANNVHNWLAASPSFLLWGQGTFRHRDLVQPPTPLIVEIQQYLVARLAGEEIPFLWINGKFFEDYRDRLRLAGVPNPPALYSCMRVVGSTLLAFPEYPYVLKKDAPRRTVYIVDLLQRFAAGSCGLVTSEELREYAGSRLGFPLGQLNSSLKKAELVSVGNGIWLHRDKLSAVSDLLSTILRRLTGSDLKGVVTATGLYQHHLAACQAMGITQPAQLASLIRHFFQESINILRRRKPAGTGTARESTPPAGTTTVVVAPRCRRPHRGSAAGLMLEYLVSQARPCKTKELLELFRNRFRWISYLYQGILGRSEHVAWYNKDSVIARRSLEWDHGKQAVIEALAFGHLEERARLGKPYGLCSDLYRDRASELPAIAPHLSWTPVLLQSLLGSGKKFIALGRQRDVFIRADNPHRIATLDDLILYTLQTDYGGTASRIAFATHLRKSGLMSKKVATLLNGKDSRVAIEGDIVRAAGAEPCMPAGTGLMTCR